MDSGSAKWGLGLAASVIGVAIAIIGVYELVKSGPATVSRSATTPYGYLLVVDRAG